MKLRTLLEEHEEIDVSDEKQEWIWDAFPEDLNDFLNDGDWFIKDGKICFEVEAPMTSQTSKRFSMKMKWDGELPYPMGEFKGSLYSRGKLTSLKNAPTKVTRAFNLENNEIEKIDHKFECNLLRLNGNKIKSVEGIHKFVKCRLILIDNNPIEGSILDILRIEGLDEVDHTLDPAKNPLSRAMQIIGKYVGQGLKGITQAQRELLENDLDDYA